MSRLALLVPLVAAVALAAVAAPSLAQSVGPATVPATRDTMPARTSADMAAQDLERAVTALAASVQQIVQQTANDPAVRLAAVQVAGRAVSLAQQALVENASDIERMLAEASRLLARAEQAQKARTPASARP